MSLTNPALSRSVARGGFTLVELSIVLVIIALIMGGILVGGDMIRSSEIKSVGMSIGNYRSALNTFRSKYNALPGDMRNATNFWGVNSAGCPNGGAVVGTCNGTGDGLLTDGGSDNEMYRFWQHLALAELVPGQYTGVHGSNSTVHSVPGTNVPVTKIPGVGITAVNMGVDSPSAPYLFTGDYSSVFQIGRSLGWQTEAPYMTPSEAYTLDAKFDDGKPSKGNYVMRNNEAVGGNPNCTDANRSASATAAYMMSVKDKTCGLLVRNLWD